ncbi:MAG: MmgE/PrpD family protein [Marinosulfonomonas sp.]|nr:MmgE/PrpD family protein [Marinosulfonomonas sp.]
MADQQTATQDLADFVADLRYGDIPDEVITGIKLLFVDWLGSALAGANTGPAEMYRDFAAHMGPKSGPCLDFSGGPDTSAFFAAMINAAASHVVEQDDLHNSSVLHPATVVFSALVAAAQDHKVSGQDFLTAAVAGYEAGIRVGEFLGRSHYVHFHTTATTGTIAAAAAVANLLGLDRAQTLHTFGTAGTKAAGLWEFLVDAADSKQIHTASAASSGLFAAYSAKAGITGAKQILEGKHGMAAAMSTDSDVSKLNDRLGTRWAAIETSYKWHASCRHTHPAADALLAVFAETGIDPADITAITAHVHQGAIDVLGPVTQPTTIHQAKFCMASVLGLIAEHRMAGLGEFDAHALTDPNVRRFEKIVTMELDADIDAAYPAQWIGRVTVQTRDGKQHSARVVEPKGDPGNPLSSDEILTKARDLSRYGGNEPEQRVDQWIDNIMTLENRPDFAPVFTRK